MKRSFYFLILVVSLFSCRSLCNTPSTRNSSNDEIVTTGDKDCDFGIKIFNENATDKVIRDIKSVYNRYGSLPPQLKEWYPSARAEWNSSIRKLSLSYTKDYKASLPNFDGPYNNWKSENIDNSLKFFLLLAELKYGPYPASSGDLEKMAAWVEKANLSKRMNSHINSAINSNCGHISSEKVRALLKPTYLPENIEDCLL